MNKLIIGLLITIAALGGFVVAQARFISNSTPVATSTPELLSIDQVEQLSASLPSIVPAAQPVVKNLPEGWSVYHNQEHGFDVCYPTGSDIGEIGENADVGLNVVLPSNIDNNADTFVQADIMTGYEQRSPKSVIEEYYPDANQRKFTANSAFSEGRYSPGKNYVSYMTKLSDGRIFNLKMEFPTIDRAKYLTMAETMVACSG